MRESNPQSGKFRRNLLISVSLVMLAGLILSSVYLYLSTSRQAQAETHKLGNHLQLQAELLVRPLLLANDRISLNFILNQLTELDYVEGLEVLDRNGAVIARAGSGSKLKLKQNLLQQDQTIGSLTLWLNQSPAEKLLRSQWLPLAILAISTLLISWLTLLLASRQIDQLSATSAPARPNFEFKETLVEQGWQEFPSPAVEIATKQEEPQAAPTAEDAIREPQTETKTATSEAEKIIKAEPEAEQPTPEPVVTALEQNPTEATAKSDKLKTNDLVDLLKPELSTAPQMPKFEHQPQDLHEEEAEEDVVVLEEEEISEHQIPADHKPSTSNPLLKSLKQREEVQLDLYSFEQELELMLPAQEAIYAFYIDATTANSDNTSTEEREALLSVYQHLAQQVARIYNGDIDIEKTGDINLRFELRDDQDSHGVNALCAAILFTLLYKGFNQSRIRSFQPVLSLQMAITRGHHDKFELVREEAHFLTRTSNNNELISHTALSEAPQLKQHLLTGADVRREDEDKVLILKLANEHQNLLQKQANHLLTKIFR